MTFQNKAAAFVASAFGEAEAVNIKSRAARMVEEALELAQASGLSLEDCGTLAAYVYARPTGNVTEELGGAFLTLAALASAHGVDLRYAGECELDRNFRRLHRLKAKHAAALPGEVLPGQLE